MPKDREASRPEDEHELHDRRGRLERAGATANWELWAMTRESCAGRREPRDGRGAPSPHAWGKVSAEETVNDDVKTDHERRKPKCRLN